MISPILRGREHERADHLLFTERRELWLVVVGLSVLYLAGIVAGNRRYVWFDELFTFDIARSVSLHQLWFRLTRFDCNPPGTYLLSRFSMAIFGSTSFGLRLPSMVEFYIGSMATLLYVRRKTNTAFGALAVLLLWTVAPTLYYAVEARPYALLFASFSCLVLSWDSAIRATPRKLALSGVAVCVLAMALAHVFSVFTACAFLVAEAVRFHRRRQPDYRLWSVLVLPMLAMSLYIPLVRFYGHIVFAIRASFQTLIMFYQDVLGAYLVAWVLLVVLVTIPVAKGQASRLRRHFASEEIALFCCLCLAPVALHLVLIHRDGTFYQRYCMTTQVALLVAIAILLAHRAGFSRLPAYAASLLLVAVMLKTQIVHPLRFATPKDAAFLALVHPELPIVVAKGEEYFEMNHYETSGLLSRVYFLKEPQAALQYTNTNFFQDIEAPEELKGAGFPIEGRVAPYAEFVQQHPQFLLLGNPGEWIFSRVKPDGATVAIVDSYAGRMPYSETNLYLVTIPHK